MLRQPTCQGTPLLTDAGAGADTGGRDGAKDAPVDANSRESRASDSELDLAGDRDTGLVAGDDATTNVKDSGEIREATSGSEPGLDAPDLDSSLASDSSVNAGAGGSNADGSGSESGGSAGSGNDGGGEDAGAGGTSGQDGGSRADAAVISHGDGSSGSIFDGAADREATRMLGGGCACRSVSDRDAGFWPGLLGVGLAAARLIRRRGRSRRRFVV